MLKKEFKHRDVQRMRNIIKKDFSSKTTMSSGYSKKETVHKEGDIWEENGKRWTIKNGLRQAIPKLNAIRKAISVPLTCASCSRALNSELTIKVYKTYGRCLECQIDFEADLRRQGTYEEYLKNMHKHNRENYLKDLESYILESLEQKDSYVTEQGDVEKWVVNMDIHKEKIISKLEEIKAQD